MRSLPWRRIRSWACVACGECCRRYRVPLRTREFAEIFQKFGLSAVELDSLGTPQLKRVMGNCFFLDKNNGLCRLQQIGMKPLACKIWPFEVHKKPKSWRGVREALFGLNGEEFYVYVNPACFGINRGNPDELPAVIREAIAIKYNPSLGQRYTTSRYPQLNVLAPILVTKKLVG